MATNLTSGLLAFGIDNAADGVWVSDGKKAARASAALGINPSPRVYRMVVRDPIKGWTTWHNNERSVRLMNDPQVVSKMASRKLVWVLIFNGEAVSISPTNFGTLARVAQAVLVGGVEPVLKALKIDRVDPAKFYVSIFRKVVTRDVSDNTPDKPADDLDKRLDAAFGKKPARNVSKPAQPAKA